MNATSQVDCVDTDVFYGLEYRILQMRVFFGRKGDKVHTTLTECLVCMVLKRHPCRRIVQNFQNISDFFENPLLFIYSIHKFVKLPVFRCAAQCYTKLNDRWAH